MASREQSAHDVLHDHLSQSETYRREYAKQRLRMDLINAFMQRLDEERDRQGVNKTELARRSGMAPESIRRLFTAKTPNPELNTIVQLADSLDLDIVLRPRKPRPVTEHPVTEGESTASKPRARAAAAAKRASGSVVRA